MKLTTRLIGLLLVGILVQIFSSCTHDGKYDQANISVFYSCTEDILDFFTPVVHIANSDGSQQEITLAKRDFSKQNNDQIFTFDKNSNSEIPVYTCSITERLKGLQGNFRMTIEYIPTSDPKPESIENYCFADGISSYLVNLSCQDGHSIDQKKHKFTTDFQDIYTKDNFDKLFHLYSHKTIIFEFTYDITTIGDEVIFDGQCDFSIGTHDNVLTLMND